MLTKQRREGKYFLVENDVLKMAVFSVVVPCSLVEVYHRFRCDCCLHHHGDECLIVNEVVAYKKIINCTNAVEIRYVGKYL
jgi:hypothetical protein